MSAQFMIITISNPRGIEGDEEAIKQTFEKALDWIQYSPGCFIVKTTSDVQKWYARLDKVLGHDYQYFICEINLSRRQGWLSKSVWEWIRKQTPAKNSVSQSN